MEFTNAQTVAAFLVVFVAACAGHVPARQTPASKWNLTFHFSGGFAGFDRVLELNSDGALTATDRRQQRTVRSNAGSDLARISTLVADARQASASEPARGQCRDCLQYDVEIQTEGAPVHVWHLDDTTLNQSPIAPLVNALITILNGALKN